jgi:membrane peptidoglycan carboxypeptidase
MVLGGLKEGVSPLGWAYAYSTIGNNGDRVSGTLAPVPGDSPVAFTEVTDKDGHLIKGGDNDSIHTQAFDQGTAEEAKRILETVVESGTGTHAQIGAEGQWGKTGTTENNGDAWFVGANSQITVAVWVGHADTNTPMTTEFGGAPVDGGTSRPDLARVNAPNRPSVPNKRRRTVARKAAKEVGEEEEAGETETYEAPEGEAESTPEPGGRPAGNRSHARRSPAHSNPEAAPEGAPESGGGRRRDYRGRRAARRRIAGAEQGGLIALVMPVRGLAMIFSGSVGVTRRALS